MNTALQEVTPHAVLAALQGRVGAANGIKASDLAYVITRRVSAADERRLRDCVVLLRTQGQPVCASPEHGYFLAANDDELNATCRFLLDRAMTGLNQVAALKHKAMPDLAGQFGLDLTTPGVLNDEQSA